MSALGDLFDIDQPEGDRIELLCTLPSERLAEAAAIAAHAIVERRIPATSRLRDVWYAQYQESQSVVANETERLLLQAHLCENLGTPDAPSVDVHVGGLVAETLWAELVTDRDEGLGVPLRVEGHEWSATDQGGDGLTVYADGETFAFRLWETKHHAANEPVRSTVNRACRQVRDGSLSYLARFSLIAQQLADDEGMARFYGELSERWVDRDPSAGVGISVGTGANADIKDCFGSVDTYFGLPTDRHHGHLHVVDDFMAFSHAVRIEIWKGCGLWIGH